MVLDASAMGALLLEDHGTSFIATVEDALATTIILGPIHLPVEVMNLLVKAKRKSRLDANGLLARWRRAADILGSVQLESTKVDEALLNLAERTALTPRDAAYVELAVRRDMALCSADHAIIRACRELSVAVVTPDP